MAVSTREDWRYFHHTSDRSSLRQRNWCSFFSHSSDKYICAHTASCKLQWKSINLSLKKRNVLGPAAFTSWNCVPGKLPVETGKKNIWIIMAMIAVVQTSASVQTLALSSPHLLVLKLVCILPSTALFSYNFSLPLFSMKIRLVLFWQDSILYSS